MKRNFKYSIIAFSVMTASMNVNAAEKLPAINVIAESSDLGAVKATEVDNNQINKNHAVDLKTAIKDVPGVEVISLQNVRQGNDSVNIRGLSGNRVGMSIDGINLPEANENKHVAVTGVIFGRGAYIEPTSLKSISISKNSAGNNIAGHVGMKTLSPKDILNGNDIGGHVETNFNSIDNSFMVSGAGAMSKDNWRGLVLATFRKGFETQNMGKENIDGAKRTKANPLDYYTPYILTKHEYDIDESNTVNVTGEYQYKKQTTNEKSLLSDAAGRTVEKAESNDVNKRVRLSVGHHYQNGNNFINEITTQLYWQNTNIDAKRYRKGSYFKTSQYTKYDPEGYRQDVFEKNEHIIGLNADAKSNHDVNFAATHLDISNQYHFDIAYYNLKSEYQSNMKYTKSKPVADSTMLPINASFDSYIKLKDFTFNAGLGLHYYNNNPITDDYVTNTENDIAKIKKTSGFNVTPKVGLSWQIHELVTPYAQYTRGFKAPSPQQLTSTFNPGRYSVWGNPDLKAETSNNFDLGIKGYNEALQYNVNAYYNLYDNFIDMVLLDRASTLAGQMMTFQAQNKQKTTVYGFEASTKWAFYNDFSVNGALSYAKGEVEADNKKTPLNSISPFKIKVGLEYDNNIWGANLDVSHTLGKKDEDIHLVSSGRPGTSTLINPSKSYTLVDIGAYYKPTKNLTFNANIHNLLNQKYWKWSDIAYLVPNTSQSQSDGNASMTKDNQDRYTSPGINFNLGVKYTF